MLVPTVVDIDAKVPRRANPQDAGADLFLPKSVVIEPGETKCIPLGIKCSLPEQTYGQIADKSSMALLGLKVLGGVVDNTYRGEIKVVVINLSAKPIKIDAGRAIAQMIVIPVMFPIFAATAELTKTSRGEGGFGSTGV